MLQQATETLDNEARGNIYTEIVKKADESMVVVPLFFPNEIAGANANVKGIHIYSNCYFPVQDWTLEN